MGVGLFLGSDMRDYLLGVCPPRGSSPAIDGFRPVFYPIDFIDDFRCPWLAWDLYSSLSANQRRCLLAMIQNGFPQQRG
jgi:hypothetical protein